MMVKRAVRFNGAKLIVIDPREIDLVQYADIWLRRKTARCRCPERPDARHHQGKSLR
jgi:nitrate reductase alpha subunit